MNDAARNFLTFIGHILKFIFVNLFKLEKYVRNIAKILDNILLFIRIIGEISNFC